MEDVMRPKRGPKRKLTEEQIGAVQAIMRSRGDSNYPTLEEIARMFGVSRETVRQIGEQLKDDTPETGLALPKSIEMVVEMRHLCAEQPEMLPDIYKPMSKAELNAHYAFLFRSLASMPQELLLKTQMIRNMIALGREIASINPEMTSGGAEDALGWVPGEEAAVLENLDTSLADAQAAIRRAKEHRSEVSQRLEEAQHADVVLEDSVVTEEATQREAVPS
jgi:predicted transcriptional regulator